MRNRQKVLCIVLCVSMFIYNCIFPVKMVVASEDDFQVSTKSNSRFFTGKKILPEQFLWCLEENTIEDFENVIIQPAYIYEEGNHTINMQYVQGEESYEQELEVYVESVTVVAIRAEKIKKYAAKGEPFGKEEIGPVYVCYNDGRKVEDWDYTYEIDWDTGNIEIACKGAMVTYSLEVDESKLEGLKVECKREKVYEDTILEKEDFIVTGCFVNGDKKELEEYVLYPYCLKAGETAVILFERHNAMGYCKVYVEKPADEETTLVEENAVGNSGVENSELKTPVTENTAVPTCIVTNTPNPALNVEEKEKGEVDFVVTPPALVEIEMEQQKEESAPSASPCISSSDLEVDFGFVQQPTPMVIKENETASTKAPTEMDSKREANNIVFTEKNSMGEEDTVAPTVNLKEKTYTKPVEIKASDKGSGIADIFLNGKKVKNHTVVEKEGNHRLVVTDQAGNKKKVSFVLAFPVKKITVSYYMTEKWNRLLFSSETVGSKRKVEWKLSNPKVGSISKNGKFQAKKSGTSYVIASLEKKSAKKKILVDAKKKYVLIY